MRVLPLVVVAGALGCNLVADLGGYEVLPVAGGGGVAPGGMGGAPGGMGGEGGEHVPECNGECLGEHRWTHHFPGTNVQQVTALAVDGEDAVYAGGQFMTNIDIGGNVHNAIDVERDIFLLKASTSGLIEWQFTNTNLKDQLLAGLALDGENLVAVGSFEDYLTLSTTTLTAGLTFDFFAFKLTADGALVWAGNWGGVGQVHASDVAAHPDGGVIVVGHFNGAFNLGNGPLTLLGSDEGFIAHLDEDGLATWSQSIGSAGNDAVVRVAVTPDGGFVVLGNCQGTVDAGGGPLPFAGSTDLFVVKYDAFAVHEWSRTFGGAQAEVAAGLAVDAEGHIFVAGGFKATVDFGAASGPVTSAGDSDAFLLTLDAQGDTLRVATFGDEALQVATAVTEDTWGNALLGGVFKGRVDFGGGELVSGGGEDVFLAKLSLEGVHRYSRRYGNPGPVQQSLTRMTRDQRGNAVLGGFFEGAINFGGGPQNAIHQADAYLVELTP
jgi:hypothetical protein